MQPTLMTQGAELMLYGMGTVFVFLTLLVILTTLMSSVINRFLTPEEVAPATPATLISKTDSQTGNDGELMAVISAAIHKYRTNHKK